MGEGTRWCPCLEVISTKTQKGRETLQGHPKGVGIRISCSYSVVTICDVPCQSIPVQSNLLCIIHMQHE